MAGDGRAVHEYQQRVGSSGGAESLLRICGRAVHIEDWHLRSVEQATGALCNLSFENDAQRVKLGELGGCEILSRLCQACDTSNPAHKRILEHACAALGNIAKKNRTNRIKIGETNGPETLAAVLARTLTIGADGDPVAMQALRAVGNVLMRNEVGHHLACAKLGCQDMACAMSGYRLLTVMSVSCTCIHKFYYI